MDSELERRIAAAYSDQVIRAKPEVLQRILDRRVSAERVTSSEAPRPKAWRYRLLAAGVAASLLAFTGLAGRKQKSPSPENPVGPMAGASLMPQMLMAQGAERPSYRVMAPDGQEMRPGEWTYASLLRGAPYSDSSTQSRMRVERSEHDGAVTWVLLRRPVGTGSSTQWLDTTWVDGSTLRLVARSTSVMDGKGRVTEEFREREVLKGFTTAGYTTWQVVVADTASQHQSEGAILQGDVFFMAIRSAPLSPRWRASIALMSPIYNRAVRWWYDLAVVGEERISVPAGEFDCWKIRFGPPADVQRLGSIFLWVSKDRQWIVKQGISGGTQPEFWSVLVSGRED